ncbi:hypothetical protein J2Z65_007110 [Paenibacillus aceris]|jgi:hypothetical protein|uniref:Uncharacterized protein n=1 Tax=Paenibacillus aceris TaxID=869555 RepID=A0ABS4IA91_9BACL|nr:hypothetical protein [Paenibacillus aceris]
MTNQKKSVKSEKQKNQKPNQKGKIDEANIN